MIVDVPDQASVEKPRRADPDSRARTHLANERTFLAWLRTGLALIAVGLAAASILPLDLVPGIPYVRFFATLLVIAGIATILYGANRYSIASNQIEDGALLPEKSPIVVIAVVVAVLGVLAIPLVVLLR